MTFTYNFYRKAEQASPDTTQSFEGASEQDVKEAVHEYCDTYGFEAFTLISKPQPKVMNKEEFATLASMAHTYDLFTEYIEDYTQMEQAEEHNAYAGKVFEEILLNYNIRSAWIRDFANKGRETEDVLRAFLKKNNIEVEGYEKPSKKEWSQEEIKTLVQTNDKVLYGALKKLYAEQTADEQRSGETKIHNGVGFNGADSRFLSSVSEFLIRRGFLTDKQKIAVRKKLVKYAGQLTRLANA